MSILQQMDLFFGVNPPSFKRRLTVASLAVAIVVFSLIITIVGTNVTLGSKTFINSFIGFITGTQTQASELTTQEPFSIQRVVYFMGIISLAFFLSIAYYMILPWQTAEQRTEYFHEEGLHKYYQ